MCGTFIFFGDQNGNQTREEGAIQVGVDFARGNHGNQSLNQSTGLTVQRRCCWRWRGPSHYPGFQFTRWQTEMYI